MNEVKRLRKLKGMTQVELAGLAGVSAFTVTEIETGRREPRGSTLRKLATALDVEVADFFPKAEAPQTRGPRLDRYRAAWRGSSERELVHRNVELADRLIELADDPVGLPRKLGGQASPADVARHLRELGEVADELHAVARELAVLESQKVTA